jgi:hypothetical protein
MTWPQSFAALSQATVLKPVRLPHGCRTFALQEQFIATLVAYNSWAPCADEASCLAARARGLAAVQLHPNQFAENNCMPEEGYSPCAPRRLYVHAICRATAVDKEGFLRYLKAMFIANNGAAGAGNSSGGSGGGGGGGVSAVAVPSKSDYEAAMVVGQQDNAALLAGGVPCPPGQQRAWSGWLARTAEAAAKAEVKAAAGSGSGSGDAAGDKNAEGSSARRRRLASAGQLWSAGWLYRGGVPRLRG